MAASPDSDDESISLAFTPRSPAQEQYPVDCLLAEAHNTLEDDDGDVLDETYYLVKWAGYDWYRNSWEPETALIQNAPSVIDVWKKKKEEEEEEEVKQGGDTDPTKAKPFDLETWETQWTEWRERNIRRREKRNRRRERRGLFKWPCPFTGEIYEPEPPLEMENAGSDESGEVKDLFISDGEEGPPIKRETSVSAELSAPAFDVVPARPNRSTGPHKLESPIRRKRTLIRRRQSSATSYGSSDEREVKRPRTTAKDASSATIPTNSSVRRERATTDTTCDPSRSSAKEAPSAITRGKQTSKTIVGPISCLLTKARPPGGTKVNPGSHRTKAYATHQSNYRANKIRDHAPAEGNLELVPLHGGSIGSQGALGRGSAARNAVKQGAEVKDAVVSGDGVGDALHQNHVLQGQSSPANDKEPVALQRYADLECWYWRAGHPHPRGGICAFSHSQTGHCVQPYNRLMKSQATCLWWVRGQCRFNDHTCRWSHEITRYCIDTDTRLPLAWDPSEAEKLRIMSTIMESEFTQRKWKPETVAYYAEKSQKTFDGPVSRFVAKVPKNHPRAPPKGTRLGCYFHHIEGPGSCQRPEGKCKLLHTFVDWAADSPLNGWTSSIYWVGELLECSLGDKDRRIQEISGGMSDRGQPLQTLEMRQKTPRDPVSASHHTLSNVTERLATSPASLTQEKATGSISLKLDIASANSASSKTAHETLSACTEETMAYATPTAAGTGLHVDLAVQLPSGSPPVQLQAHLAGLSQEMGAQYIDERASAAPRWDISTMASSAALSLLPKDEFQVFWVEDMLLKKHPESTVVRDFLQNARGALVLHMRRCSLLIFPKIRESADWRFLHGSPSTRANMFCYAIVSRLKMKTVSLKLTHSPKGSTDRFQGMDLGPVEKRREALLVFPESLVSDEEEFMLHLERRRLKAYSMRREGNWDHFVTRKEFSVIVFHECFKDFHTLPGLGKVLCEKSQISLVSFKEGTTKAGGASSLPRLCQIFPSGRALLMLDDCFDLDNSPDQTLKLIQHLRSRRVEHKMLGRPALLDWIEDVGIEENVRVSRFKGTGETPKLEETPTSMIYEELRQKSRSTDELVTATELELPRYRELFDKDRRAATDHMLEWFNEWIVENAALCRRFIVITFSGHMQKLQWRSRYCQMEFKTPFEYLEYESRQEKRKMEMNERNKKLKAVAAQSIEGALRSPGAASPSTNSPLSPAPNDAVVEPSETGTAAATARTAPGPTKDPRLARGNAL